MQDSLLKTGIDTAVTTGAIINVADLPLDDFKAPLIALVSSLLVQLSLKALKLVSKFFIKK